MSQAAATPTPPTAEEPLADLVVRLVSEGAAKIDGVDAAYVSRDGSEFVLTGASRATEMYERCAEFAVQLCDQVDETLGRTVRIMGGWTRDSRPVQGWTVAYSR